MTRRPRIFVATVLCVLCFWAAAATAAQEKRIFDQAELLAPDEEAGLEKLVGNFALRRQLDMVLLTTNKTMGKSSRAYADDFYDARNFGMGPEKSGLLLLIDMENRQAYISTHGAAIRVFTDSRISSLLDLQYPRLKAGDYRGAFAAAIDAADGMAAAPPPGPMPPRTRLPVALGIGLVIGTLVTAAVRFRYKKEFIETGIDERIDTDLTLTRSDDIPAGSSVSSRVIETRNSGGGGGSSTHTSSSSRTHGGGGRGF